MPSFRELIAAHSPVLLLDAASSRVQAGWLDNDAPVRWATSDEEAGIGLFQCLQSLETDVNLARAFVFCDGPGSILGTRTVAMALRTWSVMGPRPTFAYGSLALVAHALGRPDVGVIADARRRHWHHYRLGEGLRRLAAEELGGDLVMPVEFRHWAPLPPGVTRVPYSLPELLPGVREAALLRAADSPDAFLHEEPSYVTWEPQIHRAPGATRLPKRE